MRPLLKSEVSFTIECLNEEMPIKGNVLASQDDDANREAEQKVIDAYENGNEWAWCCVKVTAVWQSFQGSDYLGGCSYESEKDFIKGGYYDDMQNVALENLNREIKETYSKLKSLL